MIPLTEPCFISTASGSLYRLTPTTWERLDHHPSSRELRGETGPLLGIGAPLAVGAPAILYGPPLTAGTDLRIITTTPLTGISDRDPRV
jgi:hypothetical protein